MQKGLIALAAGISLLGAGTAHAVTLNSTGAVSGVVNTTKGNTSSGSTSVKANTTTTTTTTSTTTSTGSSSNGTSNAGVDVNADATAALNSSLGSFLVTHERGFANSSDNSSTNADITSEGQVHSAADFKSYVSQMVQGDANFESTNVDSNGLDMKYSQSARFLGFIPGHLKTLVHVDDSGKVSVQYPWYSFLASSNDRRALETALQAKIDAAFTANASSSAHSLTHLSASVWAHLISSVRDILSGSVSAETDTNASTNTSSY